MSDSLVEFASAGIGATLFGAFSDSDGDIGNGDDFFLLHIQGGGGDQFLLDYVQLVFTNPVGFEFASTVTETPFLTFLPGFGPGDLPNVLGPPDGQQHVGLVGGRIVFAFPTSATSTAPEPPSFGLVALGVGRHVRRRCTSCGSAVGSEYHLTKALSNAGFFVTIGGKKVRPKIHP